MQEDAAGGVLLQETSRPGEEPNQDSILLSYLSLRNQQYPPDITEINSKPFGYCPKSTQLQSSPAEC